MNTNKTLSIVKSNQVVTIKADKTHDDEMSEAVNKLLEELGNSSRAIPFLAVFPSDGSSPIVISGPVFQGDVTKALKEAGPSRRPSATAAKNLVTPTVPERQAKR